MLYQKTRRLLKIQKKLFKNVFPNSYPSLLPKHQTSVYKRKEKPLYQKINIRADIETVEGNQLLHWIIQDNGAGIPEEKICQIFERGASSKRAGLTGLGLHWCANTITAMKGRIWAESQGPHHGASFHLLIPITVKVEPIESEKEAINEF